MQEQEATSLYYISTFYHFKPLEKLDEIKIKLKFFADVNNVNGLVILAKEGLNSTFSAPSISEREYFKNFLRELIGVDDITFKDSFAESCPFRRFSVKIRDEIVTLDTPELTPQPGKNHHLTPAEWNQVLKNEKDFVKWFDDRILQ